MSRVHLSHLFKWQLKFAVLLLSNETGACPPAVKADANSAWAQQHTTVWNTGSAEMGNGWAQLYYWWPVTQNWSIKSDILSELTFIYLEKNTGNNPIIPSESIHSLPSGWKAALQCLWLVHLQHHPIQQQSCNPCITCTWSVSSCDKFLYDLHTPRQPSKPRPEWTNHSLGQNHDYLYNIQNWWANLVRFNHSFQEIFLNNEINKMTLHA